MSNNERFTYLLTDINGVRIIRIRDVTYGRSRTRPSLRGIDASAYHLPLSASASAELLANCHATVQKLLVRQVLKKSKL